mgnify:CR=1 FL=1
MEETSEYADQTEYEEPAEYEEEPQSSEDVEYDKQEDVKDILEEILKDTPAPKVEGA